MKKLSKSEEIKFIEFQLWSCLNEQERVNDGGESDIPENMLQNWIDNHRLKLSLLINDVNNSDEVNILTFKQLIKSVSNDITDLKSSAAAPSKKIDILIKLTKQRIHLVENAIKNYPAIDWITEALGEMNSKIQFIKAQKIANI